MDETSVSDGVERSCAAATPAALEQLAPTAVAQSLTLGKGAPRAELEGGIGTPLGTGSLRPDEDLSRLPVACTDALGVERDQRVAQGFALTRAMQAWATAANESRQRGEVRSDLGGIRQAVGLEDDRHRICERAGALHLDGNGQVGITQEHHGIYRRRADDVTGGLQGADMEIGAIIVKGPLYDSLKAWGGCRLDPAQRSIRRRERRIHKRDTSSKRGCVESTRAPL